MSLKKIQALDLFFASRSKPRRVLLGYHWAVLRTELFFKPKPKSKEFLAMAQTVVDMQDEVKKLSDKDLSNKIHALRELFSLGKEDTKDTLDALALVGEMAFRTRKERPYLPQIAGALGILKTCIVEMATGEGKTLTASLAAVISAWKGKGCHVLTSNDYLAERDAKEMTAFYKACFLSCSFVVQGMSPLERKNAYLCDITYSTSKEVTADFLRDQLALGTLQRQSQLLVRMFSNENVPEVVQRGLYVAIVDEADSVLCDGGSTPLIISVPRENAPTVVQYELASKIADKLKIGSDFKVNMKFREALLTDLGKKKVMQSLSNKWARPSRAMELVLQAIEARHFFINSVQYVVQDNKIVIVDEATGRIMPDHEWRDGLHQAVAAKEGVELIPPRGTTAQITFQDFFLRYKKISGMTGTAWEARKEFLQFYRLFVLPIPTHRPCKRKLSYRAFHIEQKDKVKDIVANVKAEYERGRAVLVGTKSIQASEEISKALLEVKIKHEVLNAMQFEREADIVALAGRAHAVTVATNMAGRGTDIKLQETVRENGGLHVVLSEMHSSKRIDRQLHGRCGRQGDPGTIANIISLQDDLFKILPLWLRFLLRRLIKSKRSKFITIPLAWYIARICQYFGDKKSFKMRKSMIKNNHHLEDMLSYSGKTY